MQTAIAAPERAHRPAAGEYAAYYERYVAHVPDGDIVAFLRAQIEQLAAIVDTLPEAAGTVRYAPEKWSIREVIGHVTDAERVFTYRLLCFARSDETALPGFDENRYVAASGADQRSNASLIGELRAVRAATIALLESLEPAAWTRDGTASGARFTVRALAWVAAGHARHHELLLRERYLPALPPAPAQRAGPAA